MNSITQNSSKARKLTFPIWQFLNQPLFRSGSPVILNPNRFWGHYKLKHLERCWTMYYEPEKGSRNS